jgi:hypothetical protein
MMILLAIFLSLLGKKISNENKNKIRSRILRNENHSSNRSLVIGAKIAPDITCSQTPSNDADTDDCEEAYDDVIEAITDWTGDTDDISGVVDTYTIQCLKTRCNEGCGTLFHGQSLEKKR